MAQRAPLSPTYWVLGANSLNQSRYLWNRQKQATATVAPPSRAVMCFTSGILVYKFDSLSHKKPENQYNIVGLQPALLQLFLQEACHLQVATYETVSITHNWHCGMERRKCVDTR